MSLSVQSIRIGINNRSLKHIIMYRHSQKFGGGRGSASASAQALLPPGLAGISEKSSDTIARQPDATLKGVSLSASMQQQQQKPLPKGSAWVPDTPKEKNQVLSLITILQVKEKT